MGDPVAPGFAAKDEWPWIKAIAIAVRIIAHPDGTQADEVRCDMQRWFLRGTRSGQAARGHSGTESVQNES